MNIFRKNFYEINTIIPILVAFLSFVVMYFFPLLYPELSDITASNFWPTVIIIGTTLIQSWLIILLPGLGSLIMIYSFGTLKKYFLFKSIEEQSRLVNRYFTLPLFIFSIDIAMEKYYFHLNNRQSIFLWMMVCLINTLIAFYSISRISFRMYVTFKIFFCKNGFALLFILFIFYFTLGNSVLILSVFIDKFVPPVLNNSVFQEYLNFILISLLFLLPSNLLLAFTYKSNDSKYWIMNAVFTTIIVFFIYTDWYTPILKPQLKKHHYAFFNDINYYFGPNDCAVLKDNKILLKQLNKKLCTIIEDFETTSAIGNNLTLTFNNNKKITLPKPKYYYQSVKTNDEQIETR